MSRDTLHVRVLAVLVLAGAAWAGQEKAEPPLRLELDLVDGSHIIGTPGIESVPVQTSYAKMDIPLKEILAIKLGDDHETASLDLRNGDKLKGVVSLKPITLEAVFGKVSVGIEHIMTISVVLSGGALPDSLKRGLVLYYSFDRDEGGKVTDGSGRKNDGQVHGAKWTPKGKVGGAYDFDGKSDSVEVGRTDIFKTQGQLSGSAWVRRLSRDIIVFSNYRGGGAYAGQFFFEIDGEGVLDLLLGQGGAREYLRYRSAESDLISAGEWHHIAFSYDETRPAGKKVQLFVDGTEIRKYQIGGDVSDGTGGPILQTSDPLKIMSHRDAGVWHSKGAVDEVMLWNRALSDEDVRKLYDAQK